MAVLILLPFYLAFQLARLAFWMLAAVVMAVRLVLLAAARVRRWHRARQWQKGVRRYRYPLTMSDLREA
jgi:uncharacterized membrane protein YbhN (UPF0104 family)